MNNKLQVKDLINIGLFTVLYFVLGCCVAIPIGFVPIFADPRRALDADHRHSLYAVCHAGEKVRYGDHHGGTVRPAHGIDRYGLLGRADGAGVRPVG